MTKSPCDCPGCTSWRLAIRIAIGCLAAMLIAGALLGGPAHAQEANVTVCAPIPLRGPENTLNPNDPPEKRRQNITRACETIVVPDPHHFLTPYDPVTDPARDRRAFA